MRATLALEMVAALLIVPWRSAGSGTTGGRVPHEDAQGAAAVATDDGLRLVFDGANLVGSSIDGHTLRNVSSAAAPGGFRVRSYTSPSPPNAELLSNPNFTADGVDHHASGWVGVGGGYRRELSSDGTAAIVLHNSQTNLTAGAAQDVLLSPERWRSPSSTSGPAVLRLSGWAAAEGLRSQGTCADEGSCRLHDAFSVSATLTFTTRSGAQHSTVLTAASFQSGSHEPEYSFAVLELPPAPSGLRGSKDAGPDTPGSVPADNGVVNATLRVVLALNGYSGTVKFTNVSLVRMPWTHFITDSGNSSGLKRLNASTVRLAAVTPPLEIGDTVATVPPLALDATVCALAGHIRIDGQVTLLDAPAVALRSAAGDDHALTIQFVVPVDIDEQTECWQLGVDAHTTVSVPSLGCHTRGEASDALPDSGLLHGRRQRGYYDGAGEEGTVEGEDMVPPLPSGAYRHLVAGTHVRAHTYNLHHIAIAQQRALIRVWYRLVSVAAAQRVAATGIIYQRSKRRAGWNCYCPAHGADGVR